jgi:hypothetical protein
MKNFSAKVVEKINTHFTFNNFFFVFENRAVYEIMWKSIVQPDRPQMAIWSMRTACCITTITNTFSVYAMLIAFPLQQCLHVRASTLRYTYIACVVLLSIVGNTFKIRLSLISQSPHLDKTQLNVGKLIRLLKRSAILMFHLHNLSTVKPLYSVPENSATLV